MTKKQKKLLCRILISALLIVLVSLLKVQGILRFILFLIPYTVVGYDILRKAVKGILNKEVFDENFLMAIATVGALILGVLQTGDYFEAVAVMLFYQTGELFQSYALGKSRKNISALMDIRPDTATVMRDGKLVEVSPDELEIGSVITVRQGDKIAIDGIVVNGESMLDTSALTGESVPRSVINGDTVQSGCINIGDVLEIKTTKLFEESTASKILELVENASSRKSKSEKFISRFAKAYTPAVCISALALALVPPIFFGNFTVWLYRALTFLVASCPCALVISIPLTFFAGIGGASKAGILVKGSNYIEVLAKTSAVVFDKTGTLTKGNFEVTSINTYLDKSLFIQYVALAEMQSTHPIAQSLVHASELPLDVNRVKSVKEISGNGVIATVDDKTVAAGNLRHLQSLGIDCAECADTGTVIYAAIDNVYAGSIVISDTLKPTSQNAVFKLRAAGIDNISMLTGDNERTARKIASLVGIESVYSELLPADKVEITEKLISEKNTGSSLVFVGDGINDAPVLSVADVGIAMGGIGSDAAIEAADIVIMDDNLEKVAKAIKISGKCMNIVYQNIVFAIAVKLISLLLVAIGCAGMWLAVFADVGVMVLAVLNAIRALFVKKL